MPQTALENETVEEIVETPEAVEEEFEVVIENDTPVDRDWETKEC